MAKMDTTILVNLSSGPEGGLSSLKLLIGSQIILSWKGSISIIKAQLLALHRGAPIDTMCLFLESVFKQTSQTEML